MGNKNSVERLEARPKSAGAASPVAAVQPVAPLAHDGSASCNDNDSLALERTWLAMGANPLDGFALRYGLSQQERRLLIATVEGMSEKEIAWISGCARATVSTYWQRIFKKTGCRSQIEVMSAVLRWTMSANR